MYGKKNINYTLNPMSMSTDTKWIGNITSVKANWLIRLVIITKWAPLSEGLL